MPDAGAIATPVSTVPLPLEGITQLPATHRSYLVAPALPCTGSIAFSQSSLTCSLSVPLIFLDPLCILLYRLDLVVIYAHHLPLCCLVVQGFYPGDPSVWAKGAGLVFSRGGMKFLFDLFLLLAISQEVVTTTVVTLNLFLSSPLGLFST